MLQESKLWRFLCTNLSLCRLIIITSSYFQQLSLHTVPFPLGRGKERKKKLRCHLRLLTCCKGESIRIWSWTFDLDVGSAVRNQTNMRSVCCQGLPKRRIHWESFHSYALAPCLLLAANTSLIHSDNRHRTAALPTVLRLKHALCCSINYYCN